MVEVSYTEMDRPSLQNNTADLDRFERTLAKEGFAPVYFRPRDMGRIVRKIHEFDYKFRTILGWTGPYWEILDILSPTSESPQLGFAVDLGTSSLVFRLVDLTQRMFLGEISIPNPQIKYGEDILSRILFGRGEAGLKVLHDTLITACAEAMSGLLESLQFSPDNVTALAVAGNTAMSHFFWGLDPSNI